MKKSGLKYALYFIVIFTSLPIINCEKFQKDIFIPRITIQEAIEKKFPYDKNALIARTILTDPEIYFQDSSIGARFKFWANFLEKEVNGKLDLNGNIKYEKGKFYLTDFNVVNFSIDEKEVSGEKKLVKIIHNLIINYIDKYPVYTLKQSDFKQNLAKMLLKDLTVKGDSLCVTIGI